jgi:hypothetical protein
MSVVDVRERADTEREEYGCRRIPERKERGQLLPRHPRSLVVGLVRHAVFTIATASHALAFGREPYASLLLALAALTERSLTSDGVMLCDCLCI